MMDIKDTLSGMVGAVWMVYTGLPFDTVKLRLQTDTHGDRQSTAKRGVQDPSGSQSVSSGTGRPYRGIVDCVKHMFKHEGLRSFWKGKSEQRSLHLELPWNSHLKHEVLVFIFFFIFFVLVLLRSDTGVI